MLSISGSSLGSPKSLNLIDDKVTWGSAPDKCWVLGNPRAQLSVDSLLETAGMDVPGVVPTEFLNSMEGIASGPIPWPLIIPPGVLGDHIRSLAETLDDSFERLGNYAGVLAGSRRVLSRLRPCRVDLATLRVEQGRSSTHTLDSFEPGPDSLCQVPVYSHRTATGRLIVKEGPKILTLQKEHRKILSSRFEGGQVMQIDFVSLEPRVLRLLHTKEAPADIYEDIARKVGGSTTRRHVKLATLKLLYGSSLSGIREEIGNVSDRTIRTIEEYFGIPGLRSKLQSELGRSGSIKSYWGRPLPEATESHLLVSHFTQSTAVDVSLGGFGDLLDRIEREDLDVIPCYVLHDALITDVHPDAFEKLREIVTDGIDVAGLGHFEISLSPAYLGEEQQ
jgi:hypothetical protein